MHLCTDLALYLLQENNLISARHHAVDLDLDSLWHGHHGAGAPAGAMPQDRLPALKARLLTVLVHAWPEPRDPVVIGLLDQARGMLGQLDAPPKAPAAADQERRLSNSASMALAT